MHTGRIVEPMVAGRLACVPRNFAPLPQALHFSTRGKSQEAAGRGMGVKHSSASSWVNPGDMAQPREGWPGRPWDRQLGVPVNLPCSPWVLSDLPGWWVQAAAWKFLVKH